MFVLSLFSYEISEFTFFIYSFFQNVRKLFKSYETHSKNSPWHVDSNSKRFFDLACLEKKFVLSLFSYKISEINFFIYSFFQNVRKLFKSYETRSKNSPWHVDSNSKRTLI